jgi:DNA-binding PadR family transcriptional regulator
MTGYDLKKAFDLSFSYFSGLSFGAIYPALKKMAKEGLITMKAQLQENAPTRKIYTITEEGKEAFLASFQTPLSYERHKNPFLMRLFFFSYLPHEERVSTASNYLKSIREIQHELETSQPEIEKHADPFQRLCLQFGLCFFDDLSRNVAAILDALEQA